MLPLIEHVWRMTKVPYMLFAAEPPLDPSILEETPTEKQGAFYVVSDFDRISLFHVILKGPST